MTVQVVVLVESLILVVAALVWWRREHRWRAIAGLRVGLAAEFTNELCAGIQRKFGHRKSQRVINEAMRKAQNVHRAKVMGITK